MFWYEIFLLLLWIPGLKTQCPQLLEWGQAGLCARLNYVFNEGALQEYVQVCEAMSVSDASAVAFNVELGAASITSNSNSTISRAIASVIGIGNVSVNSPRGWWTKAWQACPKLSFQAYTCLDTKNCKGQELQYAVDLINIAATIPTRVINSTNYTEPYINKAELLAYVNVALFVCTNEYQITNNSTNALGYVNETECYNDYVATNLAVQSALYGMNTTNCTANKTDSCGAWRTLLLVPNGDTTFANDYCTTQPCYMGNNGSFVSLAEVAPNATEDLLNSLLYNGSATVREAFRASIDSYKASLSLYKDELRKSLLTNIYKPTSGRRLTSTYISKNPVENSIKESHNLRLQQSPLQQKTNNAIAMSATP